MSFDSTITSLLTGEALKAQVMSSESTDIAAAGPGKLGLILTVTQAVQVKEPTPVQILARESFDGVLYTQPVRRGAFLSVHDAAAYFADIDIRAPHTKLILLAVNYGLTASLDGFLG